MRITRGKAIVCFLLIFASAAGIATADTTFETWGQLNSLDPKDRQVFAYAQTVEDADSIFVTLPGVMVTAFNTTRRLLDTPGSVSLIGHRVLEGNRVTTLVPLLQQVPGVFAHSGTLNTSRITIRGIGARVPYATGKIRAYFNHIPLTNGSGVSLVEHIDPAVIERIEITKGPASSSYGAGLGGTILISARKPSFRENGVRLASDIGSFGMVRNSLTADVGNRNLGTSLIYNRVRSDGYRDNNIYRRDVLTSVAQWSPATAFQVTSLVTFSNTKGEIPSSIDSVLFNTNPRAAAANWKKTNGYEDVQILLGGLSAQYILTDVLTLDMSAYATMHKEMEMRPFDVLYEDRISGGSRLGVNYSTMLGNASFDMVVGGELFLERFNYDNYENLGGLGVQGNRISANIENISTYRTFLQADLAFLRFVLSGGVNLNHTKIKYTDIQRIGGNDRSGDYIPGAILSPRIGANYRFHPQHAIFINVSHGFSPAALSETLTPEGFINMDINPETSWSYESGIRGSVGDNRLFYDVNLFRMDVRNLLVAERVGEDAWVGRNAGASRHSGLELEWQAILYKRHAQPAGTASRLKPNQISVGHAYAYSHFIFTDFVDYGLDYSGNRLPGIPDHTSFATITTHFESGIYLEGRHRYVGTMPMNDINSRTTPSYHLFDLKAGFRKRFNTIQTEVYGMLMNLSDVKYASMILVNAPSFGSALPRYYYPGMPRHFSAGITISFLPG